MNHTHKRLLLQLVSDYRRQLDDSRRLAVAAFSPAHPFVGQILARIEELDQVREAIVRERAA